MSKKFALTNSRGAKPYKLRLSSKLKNIYISNIENAFVSKNGFVVSSIIYSILILFVLLIASILMLLGSRKLSFDKLKKEVAEYLNNGNILEPEDPKYKDNSGANTPDLLANMIPIKYENNNWVYADVKEKWYDYDTKQWANAIVLNSGVTKNIGDTIAENEIALWYVWIPRYKYQLFNANNGSVSPQIINITFENNTETTGTVKCTDSISGSGTSSEVCTNAVNGNWYTHPAFTFGNQQLTGFWMGKFEISGTTSKITIKPNVSSLRSQTMSTFFTSIQNISSSYNISNADSHMIKNMEWGAVAYLKQSKYGLGTTDIGVNFMSITGCGEEPTSGGSSSCNAYNTSKGMLASTNGNITGVYDMSGGSWEPMMASIVNSSGAFYSADSGFTSAPEEKYYDKYTYDSSNSTHGRGKLGDATKETLLAFGNVIGGWYSDFARFPSGDQAWFVRGYFNIQTDLVDRIGIFEFHPSNNISYTFPSARAILVRK